MDTSGQATAGMSRRDSRAHASHPATRTKPTAAVAAACVAGLILGGCAAPVMKMGKPPATDRLSELQVGQSTTKEVIAVLGEPQGRGATRSQSYGLKDAWLYESSELDASKTPAQLRIRMLMVFLDKDTGVYQGHMWFASGALIGQTK